MKEATAELNVLVAKDSPNSEFSKVRQAIVKVFYLMLLTSK